MYVTHLDHLLLSYFIHLNQAFLERLINSESFTINQLATPEIKPAPPVPDDDAREIISNYSRKVR